MRAPKTLARIAESGFVGEVFRKSRLFGRSSIEDETIREAVALLDHEIKNLRKDHPDRDRKVKARERLISVSLKSDARE
jgi:hypothetical protein